MKWFSKDISYILTFVVSIILFGVIFFGVNYGISMENFMLYTEVPLSSFILFHLFVLEFLVSNFYYIAFGLFFIILIFELKYKSPLKNRIRISVLCTFIVTLNFFTISFLCGIIHQTQNSIRSQVVAQHIKESLANDGGNP